MGMSTYVIGFRPPDEKWQKMKAIYDACEEAGVELPDEVDDFFEGEAPDEVGVEVNIKEAVSEWFDDSSEGIEIDITKLPKGVTIIRFVNSW